MTNSARHASRAPSAMRCAHASSSPSPTRAALAARRRRRSVQERRRDDAVVGGGIGPRRHARLEPLAEVEPGVPQELLVRCGVGALPRRDPDAATRPLRAARTRPTPTSTAADRGGRRGRRSGARAPTARAPRHPPSRPSPADMSSNTIPDGPSPAGLGMTVGTRPSAHWSAARSSSHLRRERLDVVEHRGGVDEDLPVAREPRALALRTVGRDVARVAEEALPRELVQRVRGGRRCRRTHPTRRRSLCTTTARTARGIPPRRHAVDLHVAEAVRRMPRLEHVAGPAGRDHLVDLTGRQPLAGREDEGPQILHRHESVGVEHLAVREGEVRVARAEVVDAQPAVDVATDVDHDRALARPREGDRREGLDAAHAHSGCLDQPVAVVVQPARRRRRPAATAGRHRRAGSRSPDRP